MNDISAHHSSTHLRPHAQHGGSLSMQTDNDDAPYHCQDFNTFRIAQIRIPNTTEWSLSGYMASTAFMFPSHHFDGSLRRLSTFMCKASWTALVSNSPSLQDLSEQFPTSDKPAALLPHLRQCPSPYAPDDSVITVIGVFSSFQVQSCSAFDAPTVTTNRNVDGDLTVRTRFVHF